MARIFRHQYAGGRKSPKWYIEYVDASRRRRRVVGFRDRRATEQYAAKLERNAEWRRAGVPLPDLDQQMLTAAEHVEQYHAALVAKGRKPTHLVNVRHRLLAVVNGCRWKRLADLNSDQAQKYLAGRMKLARKEGGIGAQSANHIVGLLRAWASWCIRTRRLLDDPFLDLERFNVAADRRHVRRALHPFAFGRLLVAARRSRKRLCMMTGPDRFVLYVFAASTGLRASELASLHATDVRLDLDPPCVVLGGKHTKNGQDAVIPIPAAALKYIRPWIEDRRPGRPLWPSRWAADHRGADLVRADLAAAEIPYTDERGYVFDFHSLRGQYATALARAGVSVQAAQRLLRHSTPQLTMAAYTHLGVQDLAAELEKLGPPQRKPERTPDPEPPVILQFRPAAG